ERDRVSEYDGIVRDGSGWKQEKRVGNPVAYCQTSGGPGAAVDHDVAAEIVPTLLLRACPVVLVGIAQSQRQVLHAVRVQVLDGVHALRDLLIALTELRSEHAARSLDGVGADVR